MSCQSCRESPQIRFVLDCEEKLKRTLLICDLWELMTFLLGPQAERGGLQTAGMLTYFYSECLENFPICRESRFSSATVGNPLRLNLYKMINVQKQKVIKMQKEDLVFGFRSENVDLHQGVIGL